MKNLRASLIQFSKRNLPIVLICSLVIGLSYYFLMAHYYRFSRAIVSAHQQDYVYLIESKIFDLKMRLRGERKEPTKVGILAIDEKSLKEFGSYPFPRRYYAQALRNLKSLGVQWIGFDSIYVEAEKAKIEDFEPEFLNLQASMKPEDLGRAMHEFKKMRALSPSDKVFYEGLKEFGNIVLGYFYFGTEREAVNNLGERPRFEGFSRMESSSIANLDIPSNRTLDDYLLAKAYGIVSNHEYISQATPYFAFFNNDADDDAINRWITLVAHVNGKLMPSLALKTVAEYLDREIFVFCNGDGIESLELVKRTDESDIIKIPIDAHGQGRALINHRGRGRAFHHFSLADAYNNSFTVQEKAALKGSVLLLGATATGTNDIRPNPLDSSIDGVENHAAMIDNIITGKFFQRPASIFLIERLVILGVGLTFMLILVFTSAVTSGVAALFFLLVYYYIDKYLWFENGIWAYLAIPFVEIIFMFIVVTIYKYMTEEREKKRVKGVFQHYLSPEVIDQVLQNPDHLRLGGQKKELTVFFSDVRGFTTISESLSPEKLCEFMNEYFTPMTSIILRSKGVLDKYIGDAVMAFWGAPLDLENPAETACQAALDMLDALEVLKREFKRKGFPDIDIGIGLNTGPMSVGNMGSLERFAYTVMGDAVNLGSRLEGLTKEYGIKIMISEFTYRALPKGRFYCRDLDDIRVKGKNEPVKVYQLMRRDFLPRPELIEKFIEFFESGRQSYTRQDWNAAYNCFHECLQLKPDDKATMLYIERIEAYRDESPGPKWDGVFTFKHK